MLDKNDFQKINFSKNEEAIEKAIKYLEHADPDNADRETAISYLEYMYSAADWANKNAAIDFDEYYEKYKHEQAKKENG